MGAVLQRVMAQDPPSSRQGLPASQNLSMSDANLSGSRGQASTSQNRGVGRKDRSDNRVDLEAGNSGQHPERERGLVGSRGRGSYRGNGDRGRKVQQQDRSSNTLDLEVGNSSRHPERGLVGSRGRGSDKRGRGEGHNVQQRNKRDNAVYLEARSSTIGSSQYPKKRVEGVLPGSQSGTSDRGKKGRGGHCQQQFGIHNAPMGDFSQSHRIHSARGLGGKEGGSLVESRSRNAKVPPSQVRSQIDNERGQRRDVDTVSRMPVRVLKLRVPSGILGIVVKVTSVGCFVRPLHQLPSGYPEHCDVLLRTDRYPAGIVLKAGDEISMVLGTQQKEKPIALTATVFHYEKRTVSEISDFLHHQAYDPQDPGFALGLCSNPALWELIGQSQLSAKLVLLLVDMHLRFLNLPEFRDSLKECSLALFSTKFGMRNGPFATFLVNVFSEKQSCLPRVQEYLHTLVKLNGEIVSQVLQVIQKAVMLFEGEPVVHWTFQMLEASVKHIAKELGTGVFEWNNVPLIPCREEILSDEAFSHKLMNGVRKDSAYMDSYEYMETYFKLLRADCFLPIVKGIQAFLKGNLDLRDMNVFIKVKLVAFYLDQTDGMLLLVLSVEPIDSEKKSWGGSSNLMFGNLLCISPSGNFDDTLWATVRNKSSSHGRLEIVVQPIQELSSMYLKTTVKALMTNGESAVMVESPTYYMAVGPVLSALQSERFDKVPFEEEIVFTNFDDGVLDCREDGIGNRRFDSILSNPENRVSGQFQIRFGKYLLDASQSDALIHALSHRVALIQGPPGTGKTFMGSIILQKILEDYTPREPILVLTYKNHALDEFLKQMIKVVGIDNVVRVGGRSQDAEIEQCNLSTLRTERKNQGLWNKMKEVIDDQTLLSAEILKCIKNLDFCASPHFSAFISLFKKDELDVFLKQAPWPRINEQDGGKEALSAVERYLKDHVMTPEIKQLFGKALWHWRPNLGSVVNYQKQFARHVTAAVEKLVPKLKKRVVQTDEGNQNEEEEMVRKEKDRVRLLGKKEIKEDRLIQLNYSSMSMGAQHYNWLCLANASNVCLYELWSLSLDEKIKTLAWMLNALIEQKLEKLDRLSKRNEFLAKKKRQYDRYHEYQLIKGRKVIAMTVTGASIHQDLLQNLKPSVVLVEEAAEIPEPHLVAALGPWTKHLIMIGDHKQLRPPVENYELVKHCNFDISMFERLILRGAKVVSLEQQNRMRPEMATLLLDIYPNLKSNLKRVEKNETPKCLLQSVSFWDHQDPELKERSVCNEGEAERILGLLMFLLHQGVEPSRITILGMYLGQVRLLRRKIRTELAQDPRLFGTLDAEESNEDKKKDLPLTVSTVDNYQGDENDVVIVSIVRSNNEGKLGFVNTLNRRCVSQSRAKCAMVLVGDSTSLQTSPHWTNFIKELDGRKAVCETLPVRCQHHSSTTLSAKNGDDLRHAKFCVVTCLRIMPCGLHHCKLPCQPGHEHYTCKEKVGFVFSDCGHPDERLCYQKEEDLRCMRPVQYSFPKCLHTRAIKCYERHKTLSCQVQVDYIFSECQHNFPVRCYIDKTQLMCTTKARYEFPGCSHTKDKVCSEDWSQQKCKEPCSRTFPVCGHVCNRRCGDICDPKDCFDCGELRKEQERATAKLELVARKKLRDQAKMELKELQKKIEDQPESVPTRKALERSGPDSAEYLSVEDRVLKYIQSAHNWYPRVEKVEKVINLRLREKWLKAKTVMFKPDYTDLKFHGTSEEAVNRIVEDGFIMPSKPGMYGRGIYFATDSSKSAQEVYTKGSNMLLLCDVLLGKSLRVEKDVPDMNAEKLREKRYDSLFAPRDTKNTGGVLFDEFVIYNPGQALPVYIIHYTRQGYTVPSLNLNLRGGVQRLILTENRSVNPADPMQMLYRIAESQFYRLMAASQAAGYGQKTLSKVEYICSPVVEAAFDSKKALFAAKYGAASEESNEILVFHGTRTEQNIDSIVTNNFDVSKAKVCAYGHGIYFSENPTVSFGYMASTNKLLLCYLLPGKIGPQGARVAPGCDSIGAEPDSKGRYKILVIDQMDQVRPAFILHLT